MQTIKDHTDVLVFLIYQSHHGIIVDVSIRLDDVLNGYNILKASL